MSSPLLALLLLLFFHIDWNQRKQPLLLWGFRPRDSCYVRIIDALETPQISLILPFLFGYSTNQSILYPIFSTLHVLLETYFWDVLHLHAIFWWQVPCQTFLSMPWRIPPSQECQRCVFLPPTPRPSWAGLASLRGEDNLPPRLTALFQSRVVFVLQALSELAEKVVHEDGIPK